MKDKIEKICYDLELGCIDWKEASNQLFVLFAVVKSFYCCKEVIGLKEQCNSQCKECKKFVKDNF